MLRYIIYLAFVVSVAMAAGGIILSSRLRNRYREDAFSLLLYFQVFIFTFGFYGIWGQVVINAYLSSYLKGELITRFTEISKLIGLPFLVFAWLMLVRMCCELSGITCRRWFFLVFLFLNFAGIIALGYIISGEKAEKTLLPEIFYAAMNFIYSVACAAILMNERKAAVISQHENRFMALILFSVMLIQSVALLLYENYLIAGLIFIIAFFAGNAVIPFYLTYGIMPVEKVTNVNKSISFEDFCARYDISPRESEIITEICNGLSNKEISEKLFISLQTVKDHTHRIYIKTNVKSRVQLINLVKGEGEMSED